MARVTDQPLARPDSGLRSRALAAASALVTEQGAEAVSVRTIAARAGVGASSLYYYFPTKEELLLQIALAGFARLVREFDEPSDPDAAAGPFAVAARAFVEQVTRQPRLYDLMFDQHLMARHEPLREAERTAFAAFTARVAQDPRFPGKVAGSIALTFWALGRGITATALSSPDRELTVEYRTALGEALAYLIDRDF